MQTFTAIPFIDWYKKYKGSSIFINLEDQFVEVFNKAKESLGKLQFSRKIDSEFDIQDLLATEIPEGGFQYFVFPSEPLLADSLWRIKHFIFSENKLSLSPFSIWYKNSNSLSIEIDFDQGILKTYSKENQLLKILYLSNSIDSEFDLTDLFDQNMTIGKYHYDVMENGHAGKDYLWRRKITMIL